MQQSVPVTGGAQGAMAEEQRQILLGQVAQLYYEQGATQDAIAGRLKISRPTVSRLLKEARETGVVEITIRRPMGCDSRLESDLIARFPRLKEARVLTGTGGLDEAGIRRNLGRAAADYLRHLVVDGDIVGVTWGHTMEEVSGALTALEPRRLEGVTVVQLNGGVSRAGSGTNAADVVRRFAAAFGADARTLPVPAIVDSPLVRDTLVGETQIARLLDLARRANVAVYSIGAWGFDSVLVQAGYFTEDEYAALRARGAVGDICSHFFTVHGRVADPALEQRTVGLALESIGAKDHAVGVAGGPRKAEAILGALRGGLLNVLITDEESARSVLRLAQEGGAA